MQRGTLKCSGVTSKQGRRRRTSHLFYCCTLVSVRVRVCVCVGVVALLFYPFASWHICAPVLNKVSCKHTHTRTYKQHTHIPTYTHTVARGAQSFITFCCCCRFLFFFFFFGHLQYARHFAYHFPPTPCGIESQLVSFPSPSPPFSLFLLFYYRWCSFL